MKKENKIAAVIILGGMFFLLSACGPEEYKLQKRYASVFDDTEHYMFSEDAGYVRTITSNSESGESYTCTGTYYIDEDNGLTMFDDVDNKELLVQEFSGDIYKDYLCSVWQGELPKQYEETEISHSQFAKTGCSYDLECQFHEDGTFNFRMYRDEFDDISNESRDFVSKEGTYEVEKGKVICTNDDRSKNLAAVTYFKANDKIYGIWYVAE